MGNPDRTATPNRGNTPFVASGGKVVAVVVTWNSLPWYRNCLSSLLASGHPARDVVVVDNGSTDGTPHRVRAEFPQVTLIRWPRNRGAACGWNRGARWALERGADFVLFLNADTIVMPGCPAGLVCAACDHPEFGIVSPLQYDWEGARLDPNFAEAIKDITWPSDGRPVERETVIGAAMLVRREVFERIGGFDPNYFVYGEEDDFCARARYHGFLVGITDAAAIRHWHSAVQTGGDWRERSLRVRNALLCMWKDPSGSSQVLRHGLVWFRYVYLRFLRASLLSRNSRRLRAALVGSLRLLPVMPRALATRRRERRGPCHMAVHRIREGCRMCEDDTANLFPESNSRCAALPRRGWSLRGWPTVRRHDPITWWGHSNHERADSRRGIRQQGR